MPFPPAGDLSSHLSITPIDKSVLWHAVPCIAVLHSVHSGSHEHSGYTLLLSAVARLQSSVSESAFCLVHVKPFSPLLAHLYYNVELLLDPISVQFMVYIANRRPVAAPAGIIDCPYLFAWSLLLGQDVLGEVQVRHK